MKRYLFLLALPLMLVACTVEYPRAEFSASTDYALTNENIYFTNHSTNVDDFEWDFGDGTFSTVFNPVHDYHQAGTFEVTLRVWSRDDKVDVVSMLIVIDYPTELEVTVREYYENYLVANASVILYPTLTDWEDQTNAVAEGYTNSNGVVVFSNLLPKRYYVDVWEAHHDNYNLAAEDVGFIETEPLINHGYNTFTALVDYYPNGKKSGLLRKAGVVEGRKKK